MDANWIANRAVDLGVNLLASLLVALIAWWKLDLITGWIEDRRRLAAWKAVGDACNGAVYRLLYDFARDASIVTRWTAWKPGVNPFKTCADYLEIESRPLDAVMQGVFPSSILTSDGSLKGADPMSSISRLHLLKPPLENMSRQLPLIALHYANALPEPLQMALLEAGLSLHHVVHELTDPFEIGDDGRPDIQWSWIYDNASAIVISYRQLSAVWDLVDPAGPTNEQCGSVMWDSVIGSP